jgi:hypothetical protein
VERSYRFWRNAAWICAGAAVLCLVGSILAIASGTRSGWVSLVLSIIVAAMSVIYFRLYRRLRRAQSGLPDCSTSE